MRRNLRQNMRKDKAKNVKQIVFSMQSKDEEKEEAGEEEEEQVEWELDEVSQGKHSQIDFETLTALAVARSLWIILQVVPLSTSPFLSLILSPSHITVFYSPVTLCTLL